MKKSFMLTSILIVVFIILCGCNLQQPNQQQPKALTYEDIEKFAMNNNITMLHVELSETTSIITYEKANEYGIMKLFLDQSTNEIKSIKESLNNNQISNEIAYVQLNDNTDNYIGFFILDENIMKRTTDITVEFKDKDLHPFKITVTTDKQKSAIISYTSEGKLRDIEKIVVRDENRNEIYVK